MSKYVEWNFLENATAAMQTACNEPAGFQFWLSDKVLGARQESKQIAGMECRNASLPKSSKASARGNSPRLMIKAWVVRFTCLRYYGIQYNPYARYCQPPRIASSLLGLFGLLFGIMRPLRPV